MLAVARAGVRAGRRLWGGGAVAVADPEEATGLLGGWFEAGRRTAWERRDYYNKPYA